jgi:hypothetical protein
VGLGEDDVRIDVVRVLPEVWNVRATYIPTGLMAVVVATDDQGADRRRAMAALRALRDDVKFVRTGVLRGAVLDDLARELVRDRHRSSIDAIKALRSGASLGLGEAKAVVHGNLSQKAQASAEQLWDAAEAGLRDED